MVAAIQAPVIMMSAHRQDEKDRLRGELGGSRRWAQLKV